MPERTQLSHHRAHSSFTATRYLFARRLPAVSRGTIQRLIEEGHTQVKWPKSKTDSTSRAGEEVRVHWPEPRAAKAQT